MQERNVNENVEIVFFPRATKAIRAARATGATGATGVTGATYGARESKKLHQVVFRTLLEPSLEPYFKVFVAVKEKPGGKPIALDAYMLRAYTYTADVARVQLDSRGNVKAVEKSNIGFEEDEKESAYAANIPGSTVSRAGVDMVFGTPVPEIPTAKAAVDCCCKIAKSAGYKVVKLLGNKANVANYKMYLSGHLKAFGNVGHGYPGGIVLSDGNLTANWFAGLAKKTLSPEVIYFNSCQVFNPPLQPAIMGAGARTFIGGKVSLLIGPSENVFTCFWNNVLTKNQKMGPTLVRCEKNNYPRLNSHGISGDMNKF